MSAQRFGNSNCVTTAIALTAAADGEDAAVAIDRQGSDGLESIFRPCLYRRQCYTANRRIRRQCHLHRCWADADQQTQASAALPCR